MLSIFASSGSMVEDLTLKKWLEYIAKDRKDMNIKAVGIVYDNGNIAAATNKYSMNTKDFKEVRKAYHCSEVERVSFQGVTYCLKSRTPNQLVCFNGKNYLIISKTELTFVIATCQTKHKSILAADWLEKVAKKLRERRK